MRLIDADELRKEKLDLIDREKLVQEIKSQSNRLCLGNISTSDIDVEDIVQLIVDAPTVDAEPVRHGKWQPMNERNEIYGDVYMCDNCGHGFVICENFHYCPNCGEKMDGE